MKIKFAIACAVSGTFEVEVTEKENGVLEYTPKPLEAVVVKRTTLHVAPGAALPEHIEQGEKWSSYMMFDGIVNAFAKDLLGQEEIKKAKDATITLKA